MPKHVNATVLQLGRTRRVINMVGNDFLVVRFSVPIAEHPRPPKMPGRLQSSCQTLCHRHVPKASAFRRGRVALPDRTLDAELTLLQVHVTPLQRGGLAAPQAGLSTEQYD